MKLCGYTNQKEEVDLANDTKQEELVSTNNTQQVFTFEFFFGQFRILHCSTFDFFTLIASYYDTLTPLAFIRNTVSEEYHSNMSKKERTKDNTSDDIADRLERLEDQPSHILEELQKNSSWFNCPQEEIDEIKQSFFEKPFHSHLFSKKKEPLDPTKIVKQFMDFFPTIDRDDPTTPLLHNFVRDGNDYKKLFKWCKHEAVIDLFNPINYQIYTNYELNNKPPKLLNSVFNLQNGLIYSHLHETTFSSGDIIKQVELLLNCTLTRFYLTSEVFVCLFEWQEDDTFGLTVYFSTKFTGSMGELEEGKMTVLERSDLFDDTIAMVENAIGGGGDGEGEDKKKKNVLTMDKLRAMVRECKLSYLYYGFFMRPV
jgi:hypothetical protein